MDMISILNFSAWLTSLFFTLYFFYYAYYAFFSIKRVRKGPSYPPSTRFAVVIAARNEEQVIGQLVESLREQDYPRELYEIIVVPNNCTCLLYTSFWATGTSA